MFAALVLATQLLAGTAKLDITPLNNGFPTMYLGGYESRGDSPATGTAKPLFLRALALRQDGEVRVVVALDVLGVPRRMYDDVLAATHLPPADLLLVASHTHSGPVLFNSPNAYITYGMSPSELGAVQQYTLWLTKRTISAVDDAIADATHPSVLRYGVTHLAPDVDFAYNRIPVGKGGVDGPSGLPPTDVPVLSVSDDHGVRRAVLFGYAAHADGFAGGAARAGELAHVRDERFFQYHPDFPGIAAAEIEKANRDAVALYVAGASGDIDPSRRWDGVVPDPMETPGIALGDAVVQALPYLRPIGSILAAKTGTVDVPLDVFDADVYRRLQYDKDNDMWGRHAKTMMAEMSAGKLPFQVDLAITVWKFGGDGLLPLYLVTMSGEPLVHWSLALKRGALGVAGDTWLAGYTNDLNTYIPSDETAIYPAYETGWSYDPLLLPGGYQTNGSMIIYGYPARYKAGTIDATILPEMRALSR